MTIATSGKTPNPFGSRVSTFKINRYDADGLRSGFSPGAHFDVLFDQIGYGSDDVLKVLEASAGKIGRYVFTSSGSAYARSGTGKKEGDFDSTSVEPKPGGIEELGYAEGKRSAESCLLRNATVSVAVARFPIVAGPDDATGRLQFHVTRVANGEEIVIPLPCGRRNQVWVDDAGEIPLLAGPDPKVGRIQRGVFCPP